MRIINLTAISLLLVSNIFISCGNNNTSTDSSQPVNETPVATNPVEEKQIPDLPLLAKYDCSICHRADEKIQGPSYLQIAEKYAGKADAVQYLSGKIIAGGSGVWGDIPMNPHPDMPKEDAETISKYILSLKK